MVLLLVIRQYEGKSYRMFTEWLVEAHYLRMFLKLSRIIPHFTTLQKFTDRITSTIHSRKDNNHFFHSLLTTVKQIFFGIDSSGFKPTNPCITVQYTERARLRKKWMDKIVCWR